MKPVTLHLENYLRPGEEFHFSRCVLSKAPRKTLHSHDFFELFWLHHGTALHRTIAHNNLLTEGDIVFVRPGDQHSLQGKSDETHVVSTSIPRAFVDELATLSGLQGKYFWSAADLPFGQKIATRQLAELSHRALKLEAGPRNKLAILSFLLSLLSELETSRPPAPDDAPRWLQQACLAAKDPAIYAKGAAGLVAVSGHSHAHCSRSMQKFMGCTPSEFVNSLRMEAAAMALIGSSDRLVNIAQGCGVSNLSHFHKLFFRHHGCTPIAFRKKFQINVVQPI